MSDVSSGHGDDEQASSNGVSIFISDGAIDSAGTWSVGTWSGDYVHLAGMRGIDPSTNELRGAVYPPQSIAEVSAWNEEGIFEIERTFYAPVEGDD